MKKDMLFTAVGTAGSVIAGFFGGWSTGLTTLLILMLCDYLSGFIVAGVFKKSTKSKNGALDSSIGLKGLCKKGAMLLIVLISYRLDLTIGTSYIRDAVIIALICNEAISLIENAGLMGVPVPKALTKAIDVLKNKDNEEE